MIISKDLIFLGLDANDQWVALKTLAERLLEKGLVREGFLDSLLQREAAYPTGLPTAVPVALSHTDAQFVIQSALAVGVLQQPVSFHEMGTPDREVMVEIVFLLAIDDPKAQVATLQRFSSLLKDPVALQTIRDAQDPAQCAAYLQKSL